MQALQVLGSGISYLFHLFLYWLSIFFVSPLHDLEMLWTVIPIWITLVFTDFFQEKKGTSLGNAVTNGAIMLWVSIDWVRYIIRTWEGLTYHEMIKIAVCMIVMSLGIFIIIKGIKGHEMIKYVGRIRETSYWMLVSIPVIYDVIEISFDYIVSVILFFPLFYLIFEYMATHLPDPVTYKSMPSSGDNLNSSQQQRISENYSHVQAQISQKNEFSPYRKN